MGHPWMANATEEAKSAMLAAIGAPSIEALFAQIPADHRVRGTLDLPPALTSEVALKRHMLGLLKKNAGLRAEPVLPRRRHLAAPRPCYRATRSWAGRSS